MCIGATGPITEYIFYCKRAILFLSSSKIFTPHPPLRQASVYRGLCCGGRTNSPGGGGMGGSIFWKTREIGLPSYSKICTLWGQCILFSVVFTPPPPCHHGSVWLLPTCHLSTLLLTLYRRCGLANPYDWRGFVVAKKKTNVGLSVFNSSMHKRFHQLF
jgi:hypothetical protein